MLLFWGLFSSLIVILAYSSFHILIMLMLIELGILLFVALGVLFSFSLFKLLSAVLVGVCLGAYGVTLLVSLVRSSGDSYFLAFHF